MYDPTVGRFTTQDPSEFVGGDENLYRYVGNSPTNFIDPTGLEIVKGKTCSGNVVFAYVVDNANKFGKGVKVKEIAMTADEKKLISLANGDKDVELRIVGILNALQFAPGDYGFLAATEGYYNFGKYAGKTEGRGWCQSWVDVVLPKLPKNSNGIGIRIVKVEWQYHGPIVLYSGHAAIRLEFGSSKKVTGVAYIDNGWQGGNDFIFFSPDLSILYDEDPSKLWDGTPAPGAHHYEFIPDKIGPPKDGFYPTNMI
jgi:hypothetical protein